MILKPPSLCFACNAWNSRPNLACGCWTPPPRHATTLPPASARLIRSKIRRTLLTMCSSSNTRRQLQSVISCVSNPSPFGLSSQPVGWRSARHSAASSCSRCNRPHPSPTPSSAHVNARRKVEILAKTIQRSHADAVGSVEDAARAAAGLTPYTPLNEGACIAVLGLRYCSPRTDPA